MLGSLHESPEAIERVQLDRLREFLPVVANLHPFYKGHLAGMDVGALTALTDLDGIPLTSRADLARDPDAFRLQTDRGEYHDLWDVAFTSGTTGRPTPIHQSAHDFSRILFAQRRMAEIRGINPSDRIANLFPLARHPNGSWMRVNDHAFAIGAMLVAGLGGPETGPFSPTRRMAEVVQIITEANPTVLWGVGSYLRRFLAESLERGSRLTSVRMVVASGESLDPATSDAIVDALAELGSPNVRISPGFGASELQCSLVACSPEGGGLHNPAPELFLLQVVDHAGQTLPGGSPGRLVLTHLDRTGTVLVRYALGDIVTLARDRCEACGRSGERIVEHHGRGDQHVKVRGQLIDLYLTRDVVARDPEVIEHLVEVIRPDIDDLKAMDALRISIAVSDPSRAPEVAARIRVAVTNAVSVTPEVLTTEADSIFPMDGSMKPQRIVLPE